jgi:hypothetical protein
MAGLAHIARTLPIAILAWRVWILFRRFRTLHAVSPESAVPLSELKVRNSWIFRRFLGRGVIRQVGEDRYYLDLDQHRQWVKVRRLRLSIVIAVIGAVGLVLWFTGVIGR